MTTPTTYTLRKPLVPEGGSDLPIARGLVAVDAMQRILDERPGRTYTVSVDNYATFRRFDWRLCQFEDPRATGLTLHATVRLTDDYDADKAAALDLIAQQFFRWCGHLWDGIVESDADYDDDRLADAAHVEGRRIAEEIARSTLYALVGSGCSIHYKDYVGAQQMDVDEDVDSGHDEFVHEMLSVPQAEFEVRRHGQSYWLKTRGGQMGWNPIQSRHPHLGPLIDPVVESLRPDGPHFSEDGYEMLVIRSPNDGVGIFERLERIFGS